MKISELTAVVTEISTQLAKAQGEILDRIAALEESLLNVELPDEATAALTALREQTQALDDVVPDAIIEPDPAPEE